MYLLYHLFDKKGSFRTALFICWHIQNKNDNGRCSIEMFANSQKNSMFTGFSLIWPELLSAK